MQRDHGVGNKNSIKLAVQIMYFVSGKSFQVCLSLIIVVFVWLL